MGINCEKNMSLKLQNSHSAALDLGISNTQALAVRSLDLYTNTIRKKTSDELLETLVNEIGHGVFGLSHPKDQFPGLCDSDNFMFYTASTPPQNPPGTTRITCPNKIRKMNFRKRQILEIHHMNYIHIVKT